MKYIAYKILIVVIFMVFNAVYKSLSVFSAMSSIVRLTLKSTLFFSWHLFIYINLFRLLLVLKLMELPLYTYFLQLQFLKANHLILFLWVYKTFTTQPITFTVGYGDHVKIWIGTKKNSNTVHVRNSSVKFLLIWPNCLQ